MFGGAFRASLPQLKVKLSGALIKLQIFLFSDGSESNIFVKVLNQIQEEGWICGLEEISAEMQKRFQLFTITGKEGRPQELHNTTINCLLASL